MMMMIFIRPIICSDDDVTIVPICGFECAYVRIGKLLTEGAV